MAGETTVENLCSDDWLSTENYRSSDKQFTDTPDLRQDVAFASFVPDAAELFTDRTVNWEIIYFQGDDTIDNNRNASNDPYEIESAYGDSSFSIEDTIQGVNYGTDSAYHLSFAVKPNQRQLKGEDWKVRVLSVYEGEGGNTTYISQATTTYKILYFGSLSNDLSDNRPQVDYGDIFKKQLCGKTRHQNWRLLRQCGLHNFPEGENEI